MAQLIVAEKLESLRRCIKRVEDKKPSSVDLLVQDLDAQDILVLNLTRSVQRCVDVGSHIISESDQAAPQTMGDVFTALNTLGAISPETCDKLRKAVGFRNVAVHNYTAVNWDIVFAISERSVDDFREFTNEINRYTSK